MFDIIQWCLVVTVLLVAVGIFVMTILPYPLRRRAGVTTITISREEWNRMADRKGWCRPILSGEFRKGA